MLISSCGLLKAGLGERTGPWLFRRPSSLLHSLRTLILLAISAEVTWTGPMQLSALTSCGTSIPKKRTRQVVVFVDWPGSLKDPQVPPSLTRLAPCLFLLTRLQTLVLLVTNQISHIPYPATKVRGKWKGCPALPSEPGTMVIPSLRRLSLDEASLAFIESHCLKNKAAAGKQFSG